MRSPYRVAAIGLVIALAVLGAALAWLPVERRADLVFELAKAAIASIPVIFVSVIVADLVRLRDAGRALSAQRDRDVQAFRMRAIDAYNDVKAIRRQLRGAGIRPDAALVFTSDLLDELDARMSDLSASQLAFEQLKREAAAKTTPFRNADAVRSHLEAIEKYLNRVLKEWEDRRPTLKLGAQANELAAWVFFVDFVAAKDAARLPDNPKAAFDALEAEVLGAADVASS